MVTVRPAQLSDDEALARIDHASWSPVTDPGDHWDLTRPFFGPPTGTQVDDVLVAEYDGGIVGFVKIRPLPSEHGDWYIGGLGVAPAARRRGLARILVSAALERASDAGARAVWLKVLGSNHAALSLYQGLGFTTVARSPDVFAGRPGIEDLRLQRLLVPR